MILLITVFTQHYEYTKHYMYHKQEKKKVYLFYGLVLLKSAILVRLIQIIQQSQFTIINKNVVFQYICNHLIKLPERCKIIR